ncbi:MAG: histidinol-phosphate transaminase [Bdellovibrionales bacterium]|nr:histidinol-phosphate transaminase [Bdellovibrionales bacterium]
MKITIPPHIQNLTPYKPGRSIADVAKEFQVERWIKLASNENPRGLAPKAKKGIEASLENLHIYPHPRTPQLVEKLASQLQKKPEEIVVTSGVDSLLAYINMAFVGKGEEILTSDGSFIGTYVNAKKLRIPIQTVPLKNYAYDLEAIQKAITEKTKLIYLANPNNPTGTMLSKDELLHFLSNVSEHIVVVLDEAYFEYAKDFDDYPNGVELLDQFENVIVTRTMSKAYGMAGLRVGYGIADAEMIQEIMKVKLPFEPASISEMAAVFALDDEAFLQETIQINREGMLYFTKKLDDMKLPFVRKSYANFLMLILKNEKKALEFTQKCLEKGLILRHLDRFGIPEGVRINTGTMEENQMAIAIIEKVWKSM